MGGGGHEQFAFVCAMKKICKIATKQWNIYSYLPNERILRGMNKQKSMAIGT